MWKRTVYVTLLLSWNVSQAISQDQVKHQDIPGTEVSIQLNRIPGGKATFTDEDAASATTIEISDFWMGAFEVTYEQFQPFRDRESDSDAGASMRYSADAITRPTPQYIDFTYGMGTKGEYPAVSMTQQAALRYCQWLFEKTGVFFRLPTEAEWEYACRANKKVGRLSKKQLSKVGWYASNSSEKYHPVGQKQPNGFGLYDMHGNVMEYTSEQFSDNWPGRILGGNPHAVSAEPVRKYMRAVRGGSYDDAVEDCQCHSRIPSSPRWQQRDPQIPKSIWWNPDSPFAGFRVVSPIEKYTEQEVEAYFERTIVD